MVAPGTQTVFQPATGLSPGFAVHAGNAPLSLSRLMPFVGVYVESSAFTGNFILSAKLAWSDILLAIDGEDTTATLTTGLDAENLTAAGRIGRRHFAHLLDQLSPDVRVRIAMGRGASGQQILFEGYPQTQTIQWSQRDQGFSIQCLDAGQEHLRHDRYQQITGRWMRRKPIEDWDSSRPDLAEVQTQAPMFNPDGRGNMTTFAFPIKVPVGTSAPKFDSYLFLEDGAPDAVSWRYVDALRYVCLIHIARAAGGPPISVLEFLRDTNGLLASGQVPTSADPFVRRITTLCSDLSIQSLNSEEAIAAICDAAGLHYQIALRTSEDGQVAEHYLRIFAVIENYDEARATPNRAMGSPQLMDLPREAPFENLVGRSPRSIAIGNAAGQSTLSVDRRRITRGIYLGGARTYEVFLLLRPGWLPHSLLDNLVDQAAKDAAKSWWLDQFTNPEIIKPPDGSPGDGIPNSEYHGKHPLHHNRWSVGRLWIFPDDYRWTFDFSSVTYARANWAAKLYSPYHPDDPDKSIYTHPKLGGGISHAANWVPRARRFGDLIRRLAGTTDSAPIVFINFNASDPDTALDNPNWIRFGGTYKVDPWRSGILFDANNLITEQNLWVDNSDDGDQEDGMIQRYIDGQFHVAIACTVTGDDRMMRFGFPGVGNVRERSQVVDWGFERFQRQEISAAANSPLGVNSHVDSTSPRDHPRDDRDAFERFSDRDAERKAVDIVAGRPELSWIETSFAPGDSFSGVQGLGLSFAVAPQISRIQYSSNPGSGMRTTLHLSDLRHSPEVGA